MLGDLEDFAASTPLQLENLASGAQRLIAFGTAADDVIEKMENLGNASMGNQERMDRLIDAYGKVQAKGRASMEELNRFTEAGVPLMQALAENLELTNEELFKFVSQGKVGFADVDRALESLTTGEGQFAGMLEEQSQTLTGVMSTLRDNVKSLAGSMTEGLLPALKDTATWLTTVADNARDAHDAVAAWRLANQGIGDISNLDPEAQVAAIDAQIEAIRSAIQQARGFIEEGGMKAGGMFFPIDVKEYEQKILLLENQWSELGRKRASLLKEIKDAQDDVNETTEEADEHLKALKEAYAQTEQGIIDATIEQIKYFETFKQGPMAMAVLEDLRQKLEELYLAGAKMAELNPLGMMPETFKPQASPFPSDLMFGDAARFSGTGPISHQLGMLNRFDWQAEISKATMGGAANAASGANNIMMPEDFKVPALTKQFTDLQGAVGIANAALLEFQLVMAGTNPDIANTAKYIQDFKDNVKDQALTAALGTLTTAFKDLGQAITFPEGANAMDMLLGQLSGITSQLSNIFLAAAARALMDPKIPTEIGLGLLALAIGSAFFSGLFGGGKQKLASNRRASQSNDLPDPATARRGTTHEGETVIINYNGDVFTHDEREATTLATVRAAGGNR
jgi:tape measure domain-containing protein